MSDKSAIEWTDATWNPTTGCDRVSPGCDHCYALSLAARLKKMGSKDYKQDGDPRTSGPGFALQVHPDRLDQPLKWRKPRRVFVNSMSDLFHPKVPDEFIAQVWAVMSMARHHTFQVLTKRPRRMRGLVGHPMFKLMVNTARLERCVSVLPDSRQADGTYAWPLRNVWVGTSVEDQQRADERIPALLATPAAVRFLSCEPLLGEVNLHADDLGGLDWVIVGGESGPDHRPMDQWWVTVLLTQCIEGGVPFFFKQWGGRTPKSGGRLLHGRTWDEFPQEESS